MKNVCLIFSALVIALSYLSLNQLVVMAFLRFENNSFDDYKSSPNSLKTNVHLLDRIPIYLRAVPIDVRRENSSKLYIVTIRQKFVRN